MLNVKEKVEAVVEKLKKDPALLASFQKNPEQTLEKVLGVKIPGEQLKDLVSGVTAKLNVEDVLQKFGGLLSK